MSLPDTLLKAYRETHYHVYTDPSFILQPDVYCAELAQLHNKFHVTSSAVITAWNRYSKTLPEEVRQRIQNASIMGKLSAQQAPE